MGRGLTGKRIVISGSRKTDEISTLIEKQGGIPLVRPLQGTVFLAEEEVKPDLLSFTHQGCDLAIFTTGMGFETLLELAQKTEISDQFLQLLRETDVASRGYKTFAALKKQGLTNIATSDDGTTEGLLRSLGDYDFNGKRVMVQLHGDAAPLLIQFLERKGASVSTILPYQHIPPERELIDKLCHELLNHEVDAVCFTTAIQVRSLFNYAQKQGYIEQIKLAFEENVLATSVGKVTTEALKEAGLNRYIAPEIERMGAMIVELARHYE